MNEAEIRDCMDRGIPVKLKTGESPIFIHQLIYDPVRGISLIEFYYASSIKNRQEPLKIHGPRWIGDFEPYEEPTRVNVTFDRPYTSSFINDIVQRRIKEMNPFRLGGVMTADYEPEEKPMPDLYQTKEENPRFGNPLLDGSGRPMKNSLGGIILEMRGEGGKLEAFPENMIELVTPYTVQMEPLRGGDTKNGCHVIAKPGQVAKDDVLLELNTGIIWRVTMLDSKCRSPRENKSGWLKIPTEKLTFGESE